MQRPLESIRPLGPFIETNQADLSAPDDYNDLDTDNLAAPQTWDWQIDDELAHHVWNLTADSDTVGFGPDPPVLLESFMNFFPDQGQTSQLNSWYYSRKKDQTYTDHTTWWDLGSPFKDPSGDAQQTSILYSVDQSPHPLRSKLTSQQYTEHGAIFTYEFEQWQGEQPTGMMRIPVASNTGLLDELNSVIENNLPFENFQFQSREYMSQFGDPPEDALTYSHPHFRADGKTTQEDYMQLFSIAFEYMQESSELL